MMEEKLKTLDKGYILDGFPRTVAQAEALGEMLARINHKLDAVVNIEVGDEELIRRLTGRRVCPKCNSVFHVYTMKPKVEGICDNCGGELIQRKDDQIDAITTRLVAFKEQTQPLIEYYQSSGKIVTVDGTIGVPAVAEKIRAALTGE
jgi:adenylate kinase